MAASPAASYVQPSGNAAEEGVREYPKKIVIRTPNRIFLQTVAEIDYLTAAANYVHIHTAGQEFRIRTTINAIEQRLDPRQFGRVHRCTIVNFDRVKQYRPLQRGDYLLDLNDGSHLKMSRRHRDKLGKVLACTGDKHLVKYERDGKENGAPAPASFGGRGPSLI